MKKTSLTLITGIIFSLLTTTPKAQALNVSAEGALAPATASPASNKASIKAANNFRKNFKDVSDVKWFTEKETITASMNRDGKRTNVVYDKKGHWLHTITTYDESRLSNTLRRIVKSVYYDYNINLVQEIREGQVMVYIFHLEDKTGYKQIALYEGEMTVLKEFNKQQ